MAVAALLCLVGTVSASAASWDSRVLSIGSDVPHASSRTRILGVACASQSLCVAVGESGAVATSTNPTGGADAWRIFHPYDPAVETDDCRPYDPVTGRAAYCPPDRYAYRVLRGVSCPSASFCAAVTVDGFVYSSTDPTAPASWRIADIDDSESNIHLESISCPDPGFCVAVSGKGNYGGNGVNTAGTVLTTTEPSGPGSAWQATQLDPSLDLQGVSCTSRSFCLAVATNGRILKSTDPAGGASAWGLVGTPGGPGNIEAVACLDQGTFLCLAGNSSGNFLASRAVDAGLSSWSETNGGVSVPIVGISCPTPSRCAAVDNNGDVLVSNDPTAARSWSVANLISYKLPDALQSAQNALFGASCPTIDLCVLVGADGLVFTSTDPFAATAPAAAGDQKGGKARRLVKRPKVIFAKTDRFRTVTRHRRLKVTFRFFAKTRVTGFVCRRDGGRYRRCHSPQRYWVSLGSHVLRVRAIGPTGLRGPVARFPFEVVRNPNVH